MTPAQLRGTERRALSLARVTEAVGRAALVTTGGEVGASMTWIASKAGVSEPTARTYLGELITAGQVERVPNPLHRCAWIYRQRALA